jgi:predicted nucleic acid-binding protein
MKGIDTNIIVYSLAGDYPEHQPCKELFLQIAKGKLSVIISGIAIIEAYHTLESHAKFKAKYDLPFTLLSDPDKKFLKALGSIEAGKIKRRTWLVDKEGKVERVYATVSPSKHNEELCEYYMLK